MTNRIKLSATAELSNTMEDVKFLNLTPSWESAAAMLALVLTDGTAEGRKIAREEVLRMGKALDHLIAKDEKAKEPKYSQDMSGEIIQDWPAFTIRKAVSRSDYRTGKTLPTFKDRDIVGLPFKNRNDEVMYHFFYFGSVASYALENGECPYDAARTAETSGHKKYWLIPCSTMLTAEDTPKEQRVAVDWWQEIIFEGRSFTIKPDANRNAKLVEVISEKSED